VAWPQTGHLGLQGLLGGDAADSDKYENEQMENTLDSDHKGSLGSWIRLQDLSLTSVVFLRLTYYQPAPFSSGSPLPRSRARRDNRYFFIQRVPMVGNRRPAHSSNTGMHLGTIFISKYGSRKVAESVPSLCFRNPPGMGETSQENHRPSFRVSI
jgi:hypothetical protein